MEIGFSPFYTKIMEIISSFNWVVNPISREMFDLNEEIFDKTLLKSLADIKIKDFDVVFLCRSD